MAPIYLALREKLGPEDMLVAYSDDYYLHGPPVKVAATISAAPPLYRKVGLRVGWGPAKFERYYRQTLTRTRSSFRAVMMAASYHILWRGWRLA